MGLAPLIMVFNVCVCVYIRVCVCVENHNQRNQAHNIESSDEEYGRWGGITTIVYIYDD